MPFPVAQANCQINGMHLVALETEGKRQFLFQLKKDKNSNISLLVDCGVTGYIHHNFNHFYFAVDNFPYLNWWWTSGSDLVSRL